MTSAPRATLAYTDDGQGEPVVFLHAFPLDGRMCRDRRYALVARRPVIVPDFAGFGASREKPPRASLEACADDVAAVLDRAGVERATLVGLSMGGYVALAFAAKYLERIARLVL